MITLRIKANQFKKMRNYNIDNMEQFKKTF